MTAPISDVLWLVTRLRRDLGRTSATPVSHRPDAVALRQSMARHPAGKHRHGGHR